jgi:transposase-like protein
MFVCKECGSEKSVKAGFNGGKQRYKCKECGKVHVV